MDSPSVPADDQQVRPARSGRWRPVRLGCLFLLLAVCGGISALTLAVGSGPISLFIPGGTEVSLGSNNTVLSNFSFQNGKSYFFDLNGNGVRNILEMNYLEDSRTVEVILHHSTRQDRSETRLLGFKLP